MADLSITAANVQPDLNGPFEIRIAGATITAGQTLYEDTSDSNKVKLFDANGSALLRVLFGVAMNGAASGQPVRVQRGGTYTVGATVAVGTIYVGSATAGGIAPAADLASGWYTNVLGVAVTTTTIKLGIINSGVAVP